jgi:hypothetical protein
MVINLKNIKRSIVHKDEIKEARRIIRRITIQNRLPKEQRLLKFLFYSCLNLDYYLFILIL